MSGSLVADLGIGPEVWLFLSLLSCLTLFFKFSRVWSVRNLDLLLLFALAPGIMALVGNGASKPWDAFVWLFLGSALWLARCLIDLGLTRRPLLEPNLNAAGLACLAIGILSLMVAETVSLPVSEGANRNPADPGTNAGDRGQHSPSGAEELDATVKKVLSHTPLPVVLKRSSTQVILSRILASLAQLGLVAGLIVVGWRHFDRPIAGLAVATCYLLLPYTRIALVDSGQLVPAALIVAAIATYARPSVSGLLIGLAAAWMPVCLWLLPLWAGFYRGRGAIRFAGVGLGVILLCIAMALAWGPFGDWAKALGARSLAEAGLLPHVEAPLTGSFWSGIDPSYRLPVLIAYLTLVLVATLSPAEKNLGGLIALSAALLVAGQFWYLDAGGTLVPLYLPLVLLMMFRPNLASKRPPSSLARNAAMAQQSLFPVR